MAICHNYNINININSNSNINIRTINTSKNFVVKHTVDDLWSVVMVFSDAYIHTYANPQLPCMYPQCILDIYQRLRGSKKL